jgi:ATP-binding cassette subfamily B multidrug efflux pump
MQRRLYFFTGIASLLLVDIFQLFIPRVVKRMIDDLFLLKSDRMLIYFSYIILLAAGMALFRFFWRMLIVRTSFYIEEQLRNDLYKKYLSMDQSFFDNRSTGSLIALATNDLQAVRMMFSMGVVSACDGIFLTTLSIVFMFSMNPLLTLYVLIPLPFITLFILITGKKIFSGFTRVQEYFSAATAKLQEFVSSIVLVKNFTLEEEAYASVQTASLRICNENFALMRVWGLLFPVMALITGLSSALAGIRGGTMAVMGNLSIGEFTAFFSYISILAWPMMAIGWVMNLFQRGRASMERINVILDTTPQIIDGSAKIADQPVLKPSFSVHSVSFRYPEALHPALTDVSFDIPYGTRVGITGKTGCGKTTLAQLLLRRYDPDSGSVTMNGTDYRDMPLEFLLQHIVASPQQNTLFAETLKENIRFGYDDIPEDMVKTACSRAQLDSTIEELPDRLETMLGEKGVNLSGGQKQRVALARIFLAPSPLRVIDDSLSALDTVTENQIHESIYTLPGSLLLISHRVAAISRCDVIHVMDEGRIVESGTHSELIERDGIYTDIYNRQLVKGMSLHDK